MGCEANVIKRLEQEKSALEHQLYFARHQIKHFKYQAEALQKANAEGQKGYNHLMNIILENEFRAIKMGGVKC